MKDGCNHRFLLDLRRSDGTQIGTASAEPDLEPVRECARLEALRRGCLQPSGYDAQVDIQPSWNPRLGQPYISGLRAEVRTRGTTVFEYEAPLRFFSRLARAAAAQLVEKGALEEGEEFTCIVCAFPREAEASGEEAERRFRVEQGAAAPAVKESDFLDFQLRSVAGQQDGDGEMPVFLSQRVLEEAARLTRDAGDQETGGVLIGHLRRDAGYPEVFAEITAQIPALHTDAGTARLTFTARTWTSARAAMELRGRGEELLGWWHSHPPAVWVCKDCPEEKWSRCELGQGFLSEHDVALHRAVFPRAYATALVATATPPGGVRFRLFGWKGGVMAPRGYRLIGTGVRTG